MTQTLSDLATVMREAGFPVREAYAPHPFEILTTLSTLMAQLLKSSALTRASNGFERRLMLASNLTEALMDYLGESEREAYLQDEPTREMTD